MATKYNYSILNDFPNSMVNSYMLTEEIEDSTISGTLSYINTKNDNCDIWFDSALVTEDETELDGVVATHSGTAPPEDIYWPSNDYAEVEALEEASTTSTDFVQKLSVSLKNVPAGKYRAGWSFEWAYSVTVSQWFLARVQFNDTDTLLDIKLQPKNNYSKAQWQHVGGFACIDIESEGDHILDLDFATTGGSPPKASYIRNARLELWRIS